jgi:phytoene dehydrogenase-like protein
VLDLGPRHRVLGERVSDDEHRHDRDRGAGEQSEQHPHGRKSSATPTSRARARVRPTAGGPRRRYQAEIYLRGFARRPYVLSSVDSLWDETRAPRSSHIVGVEELAAPRRVFSPDEWRRVKAGFTDNLLAEWARYAPNMTRDNVIGLRVYGPDDIERERPDMVEGGYSTGSTIASQLGRFRPFPELRGHRMVLDNVYNCSANLHSGSGIGRGSSYNCFAAIAADLGLEAPETRPARAARPQAARR